MTFFLTTVIGVCVVQVASASPTPPNPPLIFEAPFSLPTGGLTHIVNEGDDLQVALDTAQLGDVIVIEAGKTFQGNS